MIILHLLTARRIEFRLNYTSGYSHNLSHAHDYFNVFYKAVYITVIFFINIYSIPHMNTITHGYVVSKIHSIYKNKYDIDKILIHILNFYNVRAGGVTSDCVLWEIKKHKIFHNGYFHMCIFNY